MSEQPPWSGVKFTCYACEAEWQLEAADTCELTVITEFRTSYNAPPCPTPGCDVVNVISVPTEPIQEGNAS